MSDFPDFMRLYNEFEKASIGTDRIINRPFNDEELKPTNNVQAVAVNFTPSYDPLAVDTRKSLEIYFDIYGFKPSISKLLYKSYMILCFKIGRDVDFDEAKQLIQIMSNRLQELFSTIKISRARITPYDSDDTDYLVMRIKNKPIYVPFFEAAIWLLGNDQYIKNICVLEFHIEYGENHSIKHHITIKGIRVSMSQLQNMTGKQDIKIYAH